jgi:hypothetical protein
VGHYLYQLDEVISSIACWISFHLHGHMPLPRPARRLSVIEHINIAGKAACLKAFIQTARSATWQSEKGLDTWIACAAGCLAGLVARLAAHVAQASVNALTALRWKPASPSRVVGCPLAVQPISVTTFLESCRGEQSSGLGKQASWNVQNNVYVGQYFCD